MLYAFADTILMMKRYVLLSTYNNNARAPQGSTRTITKYFRIFSSFINTVLCYSCFLNTTRSVRRRKNRLQSVPECDMVVAQLFQSFVHIWMCLTPFTKLLLNPVPPLIFSRHVQIGTRSHEYTNARKSNNDGVPSDKAWCICVDVWPHNGD